MIKEENLVLKCHQEKLDKVLKEKNELNDIHDNPNTVENNLRSNILSKDD